MLAKPNYVIVCIQGFLSLLVSRSRTHVIFATFHSVLFHSVHSRFRPDGVQRRQRGFTEKRKAIRVEISSGVRGSIMKRYIHDERAEADDMVRRLKVGDTLLAWVRNDSFADAGRMRVDLSLLEEDKTAALELGEFDSCTAC